MRCLPSELCKLFLLSSLPSRPWRLHDSWDIAHLLSTCLGTARCLFTNLILLWNRPGTPILDAVRFNWDIAPFSIADWEQPDACSQELNFFICGTGRKALFLTRSLRYLPLLKFACLEQAFPACSQFYCGTNGSLFLTWFVCLRYFPSSITCLNRLSGLFLKNNFIVEQAESLFLKHRRKMWVKRKNL